MAFIRSYTAQGDPKFRYTTMRAGRLYHAKFLSAIRGRRGSARRRRLVLHAGDTLLADHGQHATRRYGLLAGDPFHRAMRMPAGDPFSFRLPKFIRKLSLKKVVHEVGAIGGGLGGLLKQGLQFAAPIAAQLLPGKFGQVANALAAGFANADHAEPAPQGTPGQVAASYQQQASGQYEVPGVEVEAQYTGARSRSSEPDVYEGGGADEEETDTGEGEDTGTDTDTGEDTDTTDEGNP